MELQQLAYMHLKFENLRGQNRIGTCLNTVLTWVQRMTGCGTSGRRELNVCTVICI